MILRIYGLSSLLLTASAWAMDSATHTLTPVTPTNSIISTTVKPSDDQIMKTIIQDRRKKFILRPLWQIYKKCVREKELLRTIDTTPVENYKTLKTLIGKYKSVRRQIPELIERQSEMMGWNKPLFGSENFPKYDPRKTEEKPTDWLKKLSAETIVFIARNLDVPEDTDC